MTAPPPALELEDVSVDFKAPGGPVSAVQGVSVRIAGGEIFGLVGESGCGKSTLCLATLGLLPANASVRGEIRVAGRSLAALDEEERRRMRGDLVSLVVQDPLTSLDPTVSVGSQLVEAQRAHRRIGRRAALRRSAELLESVGIADAGRRLKDPPHRFSGGMRQRVVIALAVVNNPTLLIADEPTTALDVTIQSQILQLFRQLRERLQTSIVMVTHDLGVVAQVCDRVGVMYAGSLVEVAGTKELFRRPRHPYTQALLASRPSRERRPGDLAVIPGEVPDLQHPPVGCRFAARCPHRMDVCERRPPLIPSGPGSVACWLYSGVAEEAHAGTTRAAKGR